MDLIKLKPTFKSMIWGGKRLKDLFHDDQSPDKIGEAWVVSAHSHGDCMIENGPYQGMTLSSFYRSHRDLFGAVNAKEFPLLVKYIDAKQDLSVQVHPDDAYAMRIEQSSGKTECWLVLDCDPDGEILIGHDFKTKADMQTAIEQGTMQAHLTRIKIKPGDFFHIPAGTVHAVCANTMLYEVQQNSDLTYRIDDYGRVDASGKPRQLHLQQALDVTRFPHQPMPIHPIENMIGSIKITTYLYDDSFLIQKVDVADHAKLLVDAQYAVVGCFSGHPEINGIPFKPGDHALALQEARFLRIQGECSLMISAPRKALL